MTGQSGQFIRELERSMSNRNKIGLRKEKVKLISLIKSCNNYKRDIIRYESKLKKEYEDCRIDKGTYEEKLRTALKDKTVSQWLQYYDKLTLEYTSRIIDIDKELRELEKTKITPMLTILAVLALLGLSYYFISPQITGFTVIENLTNGTNAIFGIQPVNISNFTSGNVTEIPENITEILPIENISGRLIGPIAAISNKSIEWDYTNADKKSKHKIKEDGLYFDGWNDPEIINNSEFIRFTNKTLTIYAKIKLEENTTGTIVSKYDYANVSRLVLGIDVTGSVKLEISDVGFSTILETNKTYIDNKFRDITAVLNNTIAQLYIDGLLEVEANITELNEINTQVPISIGGNADFGTFDNFKGLIKEVKIYY